MFTGIIEALGKLEKLEIEGSNRHFLFSSPISDELKIDQSVTHDGVCLTVTKLGKGQHWVTAIDETLQKSTLGTLQEGGWVNLERSMLNNGRFDGHIVQGHVDLKATVDSVKDVKGSWIFKFAHPTGSSYITVEKGSICVNGVSLTCFDVSPNGFSVAIIPYTYEHTSFKTLKENDFVNLEFDIIGKYISRLLPK